MGSYQFVYRDEKLIMFNSSLRDRTCSNRTKHAKFMRRKPANRRKFMLEALEDRRVMAADFGRTLTLAGPPRTLELGLRVGY